ncbi:DUF6319 family protein [Gandjariella thermophila]|uniref:Cell wall anchor protein n=1 Tax=Gandjariella thermophila TaxID=1931992 RepID=A0A4D4JD71_9PSEU|nr:DUF6319 family protein [Gandjariella thermophila]GDY32960.1 hypothetical protein GTS_45930 [Gandjariella thermophila]
MAKVRSLSEEDLQFLRAELAAGRTPTVWFTPNAVGMTAGRSAKVTAFTAPEEGDFIQVRPTGSRDVLSFSPAEMTLTKPPRKKPATSAASAVSGSGTSAASPSPGGPAADPVGSRRAQPADDPGGRPASVRRTSGGGASAVVGAEQPARRGGARKSRPAEVTVTLSSTAEGEWTVDVVAGKKRTVRAVPVPASAVAKAAKELHPDVSEAIEAVLEAARAQQRARIEQLQAELDAAQRALSELSG